MSGQLRVSVVVAAYNAAAYLPRALSSVLGQSERGIEILVVDDASTDATPDVIATYARTDARVRALRCGQNVGPAAARNLGIRHAAGEWIAVLDADDRFSRHRLRILLSAAEAGGADMVSDAIEIFDDRTGTTVGPMFRDGEVPDLVSALAFVNGNLPDPARPRAGFGFLKPLVRRRFLAEAGLSYAPGMRFAEDYRLYLELLLSGARWVTVPDRLYGYAVRDDSATARHRSVDLDRLRGFEHALLKSGTWTLGRELRAALQAHRRTLDERYYDAVFAESIERRHLGDALAAFTLSPLAFRRCARHACKGVARRLRPSRLRAGVA